MHPRFFLAMGLSLVLGAGFSYSASAQGDGLGWPAVTAQTRPWAWWWWHGSAVDQTNITAELERFHDAGLGGVQITAIYGLQGGESRDIQYLSPTWLDLMGFSVSAAQRLGMGVSMTLGTGWCFGGPTVSDEDANVFVRVKTYKLGQISTEKFDPRTTQALILYGPDGQVQDITGDIATNGSVNFMVPASWASAIGSKEPVEWTVYAVSQAPSPQKVKRPAPGGEGWMLNPAYPDAMRRWLTWFDVLTNYSGPKPFAVFQDSYEYRTDWAPDFLQQFAQRRGYKLQSELPALFGDQEDEHAARVKYDYRLTLSDIMAGESELVWIDWAHRHGFSTIYQAHGAPGNWLDLYGDADMPETEMFHNNRSILISKFASSAAHTQGRPLAGAETGTWLKEHFTETLADMKYLADDMFLAGINRIFYHGACYSPADAAWPGWVFYASTEMNSRNPIWHDVPVLNEYITRCQSVLQGGGPDNDVLLYWPVADFWSEPGGRVQDMTVRLTDWYFSQSVSKAARELWERGYGFDYVSDQQLLAAKASPNDVALPGGHYKVIVVPACQYMPLETFKKLLGLATAGATVVFEDGLPQDVPGWNDLAARRRELGLLEQFGIRFTVAGGNFPVAVIGQGQFVIGHPTAQWWAKLGAVREPLVDKGLAYIRRAEDGGWSYFIANRGDSDFDGWVALGRPANSVVRLDPLTGRTGLAETRRNAISATEVRLQLAAGQSVLLRVRENETVTGPMWSDWRTNGQPVTVTGSWQVTFQEGGPVLPASYQTATAASWTRNGDPETERFAGTADYAATFAAPVAAGQKYVLDLGEVLQSARVTLNGVDYGTLITPPFRVVVDNLQPTGNRLVVEVTSVGANRIRDLDRRGVPWKNFKDINFVNVDYQPFDASNWPVADCGLLGPVVLAPAH